MIGLTDLQQLAYVREVTGDPVRMRPFESLISMTTTETSISLVIEVHDFADGETQVKFTRRGSRMIGWSFTDEYTFPTKTCDFTIWDNTFQPYLLAKYGKCVTWATYRERIEFARDCYRPGTDTNPLDGYQRVLEGATTSAMERYW